MKLYQKILIGILSGIIGLPTITLGGSFTVSLIQGKTVEEAVQILAEQIDSLIGRVGVLETKQIELAEEQEKQWCGKSFKELPYGINAGYIQEKLNQNIMRYYTINKFVLDNKLDFNQERLLRWQERVNELEPLYTAFVKRCPNYPTNEISTKTLWCIGVERLAKCYQSYGVGHRPPDELEQFMEVKYLEFGCEQLLNEEAPNRTQYLCG